MPISSLPIPPSRQDPTNFNDRADAFLGALPLFQSEANALQTNVNNSEVNSVNSAAAVLAATNIVKWVSGTTYANGAVVWSPINGLGYRRITASGSGTTDPSADSTNYKQVNGTGDVSTSGNQTIAGVKTFSNGIVGNVTGSVTGNVTGDVSGNAGTVTNGVYTSGNQTIAGVKTFSSGIVGSVTGNVAGNADSATKLSTASGSAPSYSARAWVNFDGTGTVTIRASANVSSITDNGTGDYIVNFSTAMQDVNFSVTGSAGIDQILSGDSGRLFSEYGMAARSTSACRVCTAYVFQGVDTTIAADSSVVSVTINR
jgi:hypothetical protein